MGRSPVEPAPPSTTATELRVMRRSVAAADDRKIQQIVRMMDEVTDRGAADSLIAPLRPRLAQLRPRRKLRFERLLFLPLDPLIVAPTEWRPQQPTIPRNALSPIAGTVRVALGPDLRTIEAAIAGKTTEDLDTIADIGARLWPTAGRILAIAPEPPGWIEAGLRGPTYEPLARAIAAVMIRLPPLQELVQDAQRGLLAPREDAVMAILESLAPEAAPTQTMMVTLLLARLPQIAPLLRRLESMVLNQEERAALRLAHDQAAEALLDRLETDGGTEAPIMASSLAEVGAEVRRLTNLLHELDSRNHSTRQQHRLAAVRRRLDAACRTRFTAALNDDLLMPLQSLTHAIDGSAQMRLETIGRQLRGLDTTARGLGGAAVYDGLLQQAARVVQSLDPAVLTMARRVRLVELLAGPEAATALLERS